MKRVVFDLSKVPFHTILISIYHSTVEVLNDQNLFTELSLGDWFSSYVQFYTSGHFSERAAAARQSGKLNHLKGPIRLQGCKILSFHWIRETVLIEAIIVRPNFHVNISEQFTIRECIRPSFKGSVNMENIDQDDYSTKEVSCSKTNDRLENGRYLAATYSFNTRKSKIIFPCLEKRCMENCIG